MKTFFLLIFSTIVISNSYAQVPDSLQQILDTARTYKARKKIQTTIVNYFDSHRKSNEGLRFLDSIQKQTKDQSLIAWQYLLKGNLWTSLNNQDSVKIQLTKGIKIAEHIEDLSNLASLKMNLAIYFRTTNQPEKALESYRESLALYEQLNDTDGQCRTHINMAGLHLVQNNFFEAENHINQLIQVNEIEKSVFYMAHSAMYQAMIDTSVGNYDLAEQRYLEAFQRFEDLDNVYYQFNTAVNRAINLSYSKENEQALAVYEQGLSLFKNSGFYSDWEWKIVQPNYIRLLLENDREAEARKVYNDFLAIKEVVNEPNNFDISSMHAHMAKALGEDELAIKRFESLLEAEGMAAIKIGNYHALEDLYTAKGSWKQAYEIQKKRFHLKDSIADETVKRKAVYTSQKIGLAQKQKDNLNLLNQKQQQEYQLKEQRQQRNLLLWALILSILVLSVFIWLMLKSKRQQKLILSLQKEMHHRIKNNLGIIDAFLDVAKEEFEEDRFELKLSEIQQKINGIYEVHNHLYQTEKALEVPAYQYINQLIDKLQETFSNENISIENNINQSLQLKADTSFCLGLIVNEFLTNAIKHAFPDQSNGEVSINLQQHKNEGILELQDNGIGFNDDFNIKTTTSFGLRTIQLLSRQLNGSFQILEHKGVRMQINFPL